MRTIFSGESFGQQTFTPFRLAQAGAPQSAFSVFGEILNTIGISEQEVTDLLDKIPKEAVGQYQQRLDDCKAKGVTTTEGAACIYKLYVDMQAAADKPPAPVVVPPPPASSFPVVPVAIGGLLLAGLVVFLATRKG